MAQPAPQPAWHPPLEEHSSLSLVPSWALLFEVAGGEFSAVQSLVGPGSFLQLFSAQATPDHHLGQAPTTDILILQV